MVHDLLAKLSVGIPLLSQLSLLRVSEQMNCSKNCRRKYEFYLLKDSHIRFGRSQVSNNPFLANWRVAAALYDFVNVIERKIDCVSIRITASGGREYESA